MMNGQRTAIRRNLLAKTGFKNPVDLAVNARLPGKAVHGGEEETEKKTQMISKINRSKIRF